MSYAAARTPTSAPHRRSKNPAQGSEGALFDRLYEQSTEFEDKTADLKKELHKEAMESIRKEVANLDNDKCRSDATGNNSDDAFSADLNAALRKASSRVARPALASLVPSPELTPQEVVTAILNALRTVDYPDEGNGIRVAFRFSLRRAQLGTQSSLSAALRASDPASASKAASEEQPAPGGSAAGEASQLPPPPAPAAAARDSEEEEVLGWVPRRRRLRAPDKDIRRFEEQLRSPPYSALVESTRAEMLSAGHNPSTDEWEIPVAAAVEEDGGSVTVHDFVFRLRKAEAGRHAGCWFIKHVSTPRIPTNYC